MQCKDWHWEWTIDIDDMTGKVLFRLVTVYYRTSIAAENQLESMNVRTFKLYHLTVCVVNQIQPGRFSGTVTGKRQQPVPFGGDFTRWLHIWFIEVLLGGVNIKRKWLVAGNSEQHCYFLDISSRDVYCELYPPMREWVWRKQNRSPD